MADRTIVWFRRDLRVADNPALVAAIQRGGSVVTVYIHDEHGEGEWPAGGASRWWLHHSLMALQGSLSALGGRLILRSGDSFHELQSLIEETGANAVYWNRRYEPTISKRDTEIRKRLEAEDIAVGEFNGSLLFEPPSISNRQGGPYQVFTPFWRHCLTLEVRVPLAKPDRSLSSLKKWPQGLRPEQLALLPGIPWDKEFYQVWKPGEAGAQKSLRSFIKNIGEYEKARDQVGLPGSSQLSAHLHYGEVSPSQIWAACKRKAGGHGVFPTDRGMQKFLAEMGWREFAHNLLFHFPDTPSHPLRREFEHFPWAGDPENARFKAWSKGETGYPIVDAGMRQLWRIGWLPNRVRMITASFLVKHLQQPWQKGAKWFWDTLVDADLANNTLGWQWIAGCGADASPYFRIFAPVTQAQKFDPTGEYVRKWVPELKKLPIKFLHSPWQAPESVLAAAGIRLGQNYPRPLVDHQEARETALRAYRSLKSHSQQAQRHGA